MLVREHRMTTEEMRALLTEWRSRAPMPRARQDQILNDQYSASAKRREQQEKIESAMAKILLYHQKVVRLSTFAQH